MNLPKLDVKIKLHEDTTGRPTKCRAYVELTIGHAFVVKNIRIMQSQDHPPFVVFPAMKGAGESRDRWFDIAHPISVEAREAALTEIFAAYDIVKKFGTEIKP